MAVETSLMTVMGLCLKELRLKREKTQSDLATYIGMTNAGWGKLENGKASLSVENLMLVCEYLNMEIDTFFSYINKIKEDLESKGWCVQIKRVENDGLILGREFYKFSNRNKTEVFSSLIGMTVAEFEAHNDFISDTHLEHRLRNDNDIIQGVLVEESAFLYASLEKMRVNKNLK